MCGRALLRAEKEFDQRPSVSQRWLGFFNSGEVSATAALCFMDLGQYGKAVDAARESLGIVQSSQFRRNQLAAQVRLGRALAAAGELEEAVAAGHNALTLLPEVHSSRIGARVEQLRDALADCGVAGAVEFSERYEAVAT